MTDLSGSEVTSAPQSFAPGQLFRVAHEQGRLALLGELDVAGWSSFEQALEAATTDTRRLVVDLSGLRLMDAHSVGLLMSAADRCPLELRSPRSLVARVFDTLRVRDHPQIRVVSRSEVPGL